MPKKMKIKDSEEEVIEGEEIKTYWDFKKIFIGGTIIIALLILGSYVLFPPRANNSQTLGVSSQREEVPPLPDTEDVDSILNSAQDTLQNITSENLTSSQAAIQKVIADLQKLQENGVGDALCNLVCRDK